MPFHEAIRLALQVIWAHKMKSAFAVIGVFIGVTFLIAVVSIIEGMNAYMTDQFAGQLLGVNTFHLRRFPDFETGDVSAETWREWIRRPRIEYQDAEAVMAAITVPHFAAWESDRRGEIEYRTKVVRDITIIGATEQYFEIKNWRFAQGRPFSPQEGRTGQPVLVLGHELTERLFEGRDPVGREVRIQGMPYRVIGVIEPQGNLFGLSLDKFAVAPALSPVKRYVNPPRVIDALLVKTDTPEDLQAAILQAEAAMRSRRHLRPAQDNNFSLETSDAVLGFWSKIKAVMVYAAAGLPAISLVVGAILIMNIMLMSVAERTREIGIRKSLGARRRDILRQFLVEAATLAAVGAMLGIFTGLGMAATVAALSPLPASVAPWSIPVAVALGAGVGIAAGLYPASRASRLDPIVAMRQET